MADVVIDASVIGLCNGDLAQSRPGSAVERRLTVIERAAKGEHRLRYNPKLLTEYQQLTRNQTNDLIELFFATLADTSRTVFVKRNTLCNSDRAKADKCRWPSHDRHLLAAAVGGNHPFIFVTEAQLALCAKKVLATFCIRIEHV